jgi:ABC-type uncharacterized transport system auxiliary subunit
MLLACGGVLTSEQAAKQYYALMPYSGAGTTGAAPQQSLTVSVSAIPGLDTDRILALGTDARLNRYANARWPDHLPEVLTSVLKRSMTASGRFSAVEASDRSRGGGWLLKLEVQQFYGIQNADGSTRSVRVGMAGTLACNDRTLRIDLSERKSVGAERLATIVAAHQSALDSVTRQLLGQMDELCS